MAFNYKRDVPSQINMALQKRQINAGFISSVVSSSYQCTDLGIIASRAVHSVFVIESKTNKTDNESATSNQLAKLLGLKGEVIIGDKALQHYLNGGEGVDLATAWYEKTSLPFVFGRLCYNCHGKRVKNISKIFIKTPMKIPQYILKKEAKKRGITPKQLLWYLEHINYKMDYKSKKSLKKFLKEVKQINPNQVEVY